MPSFVAGIDCVSVDPGKLESFVCRVCGVECEVQRNIDGPTSWAESIAKMKHMHDSFKCKQAMDPWHLQARALLQEKRKTNSTRLKQILQEEIDEILRTKQTTGDWEPGCLD